MRIEFSTEGGIAHFPGLSKPVVLDSAKLPPQEAEELEKLLEACNFFNLPRSLGTLGRGAADQRQHTVSISQGRRRRTVRVTEPVNDPALQELLQYLEAKANEQRRANAREAGQSDNG